MIPWFKRLFGYPGHRCVAGAPFCTRAKPCWSCLAAYIAHAQRDLAPPRRTQEDAQTIRRRAAFWNEVEAQPKVLVMKARQ